ncbi:N-acetylornithine aminotransferase [Synechococcus elongatus PCC 6301]|uniref:Acetylornithine aminotransferase n=1 Tax=Synechococcus sp. (strain ATCC 27144 / PCC 6301 / SAUG 1402/1) TaxID=269084 RepID=A0A0H3K6P0_SYNP6|nr:aspartate aminotransferase family protein [Synechococcus elongatus]BAD78789.1 N-acetylornithine aminotransferase [Synechococcus elongatus PCC 6301]
MSPETVLAAVDAAIASPFSTDAFDACVMQTYGRFPLALERGEGCRVWDTQGRSYLDFVAGIATCTLGHAHPELVDAISDQIRKLHHVSNLYYIPEQGQLAAWLTANSCADRVFFCNSGAEANEAAIKLARKHGNTVLEAENPIILTAQASFHGRTLAAVTATGQPKYHKGFQPLVQGFRYVPYNGLAAPEATLAELDAAGETVAAILLEPLQGEGGVNPGDRAYFQAVRQLCDQRRMLLILDEVQVGMGRSGQLWGYENLGIEPDAFTVAKGLGGGVPIGALLVKASCNILQAGEHASTFGGNPLACRAGLAIAQVMERDQLLANVQARGEQLRAGLQELVDRYPNLLAGVRGWGLINGLVLRNDPNVTPIALVKAAIEQGLLLVPAGAEVVRFVPPLIVSAAEIDEALAMTERALLAIAGE